MTCRKIATVTALVTESLFVRPDIISMPSEKVSSYMNAHGLICMLRSEVVVAYAGTGVQSWVCSGQRREQAFDGVDILFPLFCIQIIPVIELTSGKSSRFNSSGGMTYQFLLTPAVSSVQVLVLCSTASDSAFLRAPRALSWIIWTKSVWEPAALVKVDAPKSMKAAGLMFIMCILMKSLTKASGSQADYLYPNKILLAWF